MGYVRPTGTLTLAFKGADLDGLEVKVRDDMSIDTYYEVLKIQDISEATPENSDALLKVFVGQVVQWNLEESTPEGVRPVPVTLADFRRQGLKFAMQIIKGWMDTIGSVPAPLDQRSTSGEPSLVASIPVETLSGSLAS